MAPLTRAALAASLLLAAPLVAQEGPGRTLRLVFGAEPTAPVPTLTRGLTQNNDVASLLFLPLAAPGPSLSTVGEAGFEPRLARSWHRRDSLTIAFDLDPRARWHDGRPVTAADVLFTFERARNPKLAPSLALLLGRIASVTAEGDRRVVVRFTERYPEQFYDATFHLGILPAHLLAGVPPDSLAASPFLRAPVGSGAYRWVRLVPGQFTELEAVPGFFLGRPGVDRIVIRYATDPSARLNLLLGGEIDALDFLVPPLDNLQLVGEHPELRVVHAPSLSYGYVLFNHRDPADTSRPHPLLADRDVRRALVLAIDREAITRAIFGTYAVVPIGPASQLVPVQPARALAARGDLAEAQRLLAAAGWVDADGDGIRERDGRPLALTLSYPTSSAPRRLASQALAEQWRRAGVAITLEPLEFAAYGPKFIGRRFDLAFQGATQDPTPSALAQSWSCAGRSGTNYGGYCNPRVDSLLARARTARDPRPLWNEAVGTIDGDAPALFLYAQANVPAVARRSDEIVLRPTSWWSDVWRWRVRAAAR